MSLQDLQTLKADCAVRAEVVGKMASMSPDAVKRELVKNLYPLLEQIVGAVIEELDEQGAAIEELIDQSDNVLHPEFTAQILGVFQLGKMLCDELEKMLADADDLAQKRLGDLITAYRRGAEQVSQACTAVTIEIEELAEDTDAPDGHGDDESADEAEDDEPSGGDDLAALDDDLDEATGE